MFEPRPGEVLPDEPRHLALALAGQSAPLSWRNPSPAPIDFFDGKGVLETCFSGSTPRAAAGSRPRTSACIPDAAQCYAGRTAASWERWASCTPGRASGLA